MKRSAWITAVITLVLAGTASGQTTWYVDGTNACPGTGTAGDPFCLIQAGIDAASDGDEVVVSQGEYAENIDFHGKAITLRSTNPTDPATVLATIINGGANGPTVTCSSSEGAGTILSGFLITNGSSLFGGGMYNILSSPTVAYCGFSGNTTTNFGGAVYNQGGVGVFTVPTFLRCTFSGNSATTGGAIFNINSNPVLTACTFVDNNATVGGAIANQGSFPTLTDCTFNANTAVVGGGLYNQSGSNPTLINCALSVNDATNAGGGINNNQSTATLRNTVVCRNSPDQIVGDAIIDDGGNAIDAVHCVPTPAAAAQPGDLDGDGDVDLVDFTLFQGVFTGPF